MEIKDQMKIDQARDRYREAQEELRATYDKNVDHIKDSFDAKSDKLSKNYAGHKAKLEEQNHVNNELYTEKTRDAINRGQEEFKTKLRENALRFEQERNISKNELTDKLNGIKESYQKSTDENNRYENQVKKSMSERYTDANKRYQEEFQTQVKGLDEKVRKMGNDTRENSRLDRLSQDQKHSEELEGFRSSASEQKFKEVSRLRNDSENLRTTYSRENQLLKDRQEDRVTDLMKLKGKETEEGIKKFENLQQEIRKKGLESQERQNIAHKAESKELEKKFNDDIRNIQSVANQKIRGGTQADNLQDELKQTSDTYENRLQAARDEIARSNKLNTEKNEIIDSTYRDKLKNMKMANVESLERKDSEGNENLKQAMYKNREQNNAMSERHKMENSTLKKDSEDRINHLTDQGAKRASEQRVEFGRVVNTLNDKNMETINSLKDDYSKDKTSYIEKTKKDFSEEKLALKNDFNRQTVLRDTLYEQKLAEMEKQTNKIIENYESRISQIARKAENEVASVKNKEMTRTQKETMANKLLFDSVKKQNDNELTKTRDKYEGIIARNEIINEQKVDNLVQRYEDTLMREKNDYQREMTVRMGEARAQFERLYKSSELEKETLRNQYEQRMENMKLAGLSQDNTKKS